MKKVLLMLPLLTGVIVSCGNENTGSPKSSQIKAGNPFEARVIPENYAADTKLGEEGWKYIAPGVAISGQGDDYVGYVSVSEITPSTLDILNDYIKRNPKAEVYQTLSNDITEEANNFANGKIEDLAKMASQQNRANFATAQDVDDKDHDPIDSVTAWRTGCSGSVTAIPMTGSANVKAYADWSCGKTYIGVVELRVTKGNVPRTAYLARKGQSITEYIASDNLPGSTYCKADAMLRIVNPNAVKINNEINIGGSLKVVNLDYKGTSEVTINGGATAFVHARHTSPSCQ